MMLTVFKILARSRLMWVVTVSAVILSILGVAKNDERLTLVGVSQILKIESARMVDNINNEGLCVSRIHPNSRNMKDVLITFQGEFSASNPVNTGCSMYVEFKPHSAYLLRNTSATIEVHRDGGMVVSPGSGIGKHAITVIQSAVDVNRVSEVRYPFGFFFEKLFIINK